VDLSGWVGVGLGGNRIAGVVSYMLLCWGVVFAGLVSLTSPYSSEILLHRPNRHPTKLSLTKAPRMMMRSQHHHVV